jgi:excinuclease ABC subunit A
MGQVQRDLLLYGVASPQFSRHYPDLKPPETVGKGYFEGVITNLLRRYAEHAHDLNYREKMEKLLRQQVCLDCGGTRLRPKPSVTVAGQGLLTSPAAVPDCCLA